MSEEDEDAKGTKTPRAADGGWGWVVVACAFFNAFIFLGLPVSFGIFFQEKMTSMEVSASTVAWIFNLFNFNFNISSVFSGALSDVFGWRRVGFVMASVTGVGYACMIFVQGPGLVFLLFGVVVGCSAGVVSLIGFLTFPHYFDERRGRASGIIMTGVPVGQMVLPLVVRLLLDEYGFPGSCLIFGGFVLNCAVLNLLYYPAHKRPILKGDAMFDEVHRKAQEPMIHVTTTNNNLIAAASFRKQRRELSETPCGTLGLIFKETWQRMCQLQHLTLLIITLSFTFLILGYANFMALLPFAMADEGLHPAQASYCISAGAVANTVARVSVSLFSDTRWFRRKISYFFGSVLSALATFATIFVLDNSRWIMVCQIFWGFGIGANLSVYHNLIIDTCGRDLYDAATAVTGLLLAILSISVGPMFGILKDFTSYKMSIALAAVFQGMCALIWVLMPLARRYDFEKFGDGRPPKEEQDARLPENSRVRALRKNNIDAEHSRPSSFSSSGHLSRNDSRFLTSASSISLAM